MAVGGAIDQFQPVGVDLFVRVRHVKFRDPDREVQRGDLVQPLLDDLRLAKNILLPDVALDADAPVGAPILISLRVCATYLSSCVALNSGPL